MRMKNKKAEQIAAKERHREQLKSNRRAQQNLERADPTPDNPHHSVNFYRAVQLAEANGFGVAYSNQAFEYWLILHFNDHQGGKMDRAAYNDTLNKLLRPFSISYDGKGCKRITEELFDVLDDRKQLAITRAKRIYDQFDHSNPAMEESSTTVFRLVEELLKYV